jgi:hypothetical protein
MVAITRSVAACQQQSSNAKNVVVPAGVSKICVKKKKVAKQCVPSSTTFLSTQPITTTTTVMPATLSTFKSLSLHASNSTVYLDNMSSTTTNSLSAIELSHHQDSYDVNGIINDADPCLDTASPSFNSINNNQQDNLCELDDNKELDALVSWPVTVDEIEWCKTNRGNDRMCMSGFTYDYTSQSLKNNHRNFRCSRKDAGCRSVVYVFIDSNAYKGSNNAEHNHPPNHQNVKRLLILQKVKDRVLLEPTSVTRIIEDEYVKNNLNNDDRCHFLLPQVQGKQDYYN